MHLLAKFSHIGPNVSPWRLQTQNTRRPQCSQLSSHLPQFDMARAALSVVFDQGRDDELTALRTHIDTLAAERSADRWNTLCRAGVRCCASMFCAGQFRRAAAVRSLVADFIIEEGWCVAEGITGRFNCAPGRLNFHVDSHGRSLHIESLLVNRLMCDLMDGVWHPLPHYLRYIAECGIYTPSEGMFYQGSAPPRAAEEYKHWE